MLRTLFNFITFMRDLVVTFIFNVFVAIFGTLLTVAAMHDLIDAPARAVRVGVTLVTLLGTGIFILFWMNLAIQHRTWTVFDLPRPVRAAWDAFDMLIVVVNIAFYRHVVVAAVGAGIWCTMGLVPAPLGFTVVLLVSFIVFPLEE
jgi:hypothetical protein